MEGRRPNIDDTPGAREVGGHAALASEPRRLEQPHNGIRVAAPRKRTRVVGAEERASFHHQVVRGAKGHSSINPVQPSRNIDHVAGRVAQCKLEGRCVVGAGRTSAVIGVQAANRAKILDGGTLGQDRGQGARGTARAIGLRAHGETEATPRPLMSVDMQTGCSFGPVCGGASPDIVRRHRVAVQRCKLCSGGEHQGYAHAQPPRCSAHWPVVNTTVRDLGSPTARARAAQQAAASSSRALPPRALAT